MNSRRIIGILALIIGLGLCGQGLLLLLAPAYYEAEVQIEIEPDVDTDIHGYAPYGGNFIETAFKSIQSKIVLSNVIQTLNLNVEWGKRYGNGGTLETEEAIKLLRQRMALDCERNTRIIEIHIIDNDPNATARIANAVAEAYHQYRFEQEQERMNAGIEKLEEEYQKEEVEIRTMQNSLELLHKSVLQMEGQWEYLVSKNQLIELQSIQTTNPMALRDILPTVITNSNLSGLLDKLRESERKYVGETNSMGVANPDVAQTRALMIELNKDIDHCINGIMAGLVTNLSAQKAVLVTLELQIEDFERSNQVDFLAPVQTAMRAWVY